MEIMVFGLFYRTKCLTVVRNPLLLHLEHLQKQRNFSQIEKEALAIAYTVKKFHQYLFGRHFFLYTDHKPLLGLLSELKGIPSMAAAHIQRWAMLLSAFNYTLKYGSGIENSNADFFSRFPSNNKDSFSSVTNKTFMTELIHAPVTSMKWEKFLKRTL